MLRGEIEPKFFKVRYFEATTWGLEPVPVCTKYFETREDAREWALKLVKDLEENGTDAEDYEFVEITDEKDEAVEIWRWEDMKVVHYPNGW